MRVALASDHAGFELKQALLGGLADEGHEVLDLGTGSPAPVDYPDFARRLAAAVLDGRAERGILLCGSGVGASVAVNKFAGIRAGLCHDTYSAHQGVEHDDMNVLVLGARVVGTALAAELVRAFLGARFSAEARHLRRLATVAEFEHPHEGVIVNPLQELGSLGQSVWFDYISRSLLSSGQLARLVATDGVGGVTSNPAIFQKAMASGTDYDGQLRQILARDRQIDINALFEAAALDDIRAAAAVLRPVYDRTEGADGFVSFEVPASVANDTEATVREARRIWGTLALPNVMIKVPATAAGIPAIETLIAEGINVNVTLMFSMSHYEQVAQAYIRGLERCASPARVGSVASFFVSRVDSAVDKALEAIGTPAALALRGTIAVANSKLVYQRFRELFHGAGFAALRARGCRVQRPLWASTSAKNPAYRDVVYVEELIGPETVNTMPPETVEAFRDHGRARVTVEENLSAARDAMRQVQALGVDLDAITQKLQVDGVAAFAKAYDQLLGALEQKRKALL